MGTEELEKIKDAAIEKKEKEAREYAADKPGVVIFREHVDAIKLLADDSNEIFSEISRLDAYNIAIASQFGKNPCHNINERLKAKNIRVDNKDIQINLPVLDEYIKEVFRHLHKADRKRVEEYLKALESLKTGEANVRVTQDRPPSFLNRLV